jgi:hypothetical protein
LQTTAPPSANSTEARSSIRDTPRVDLSWTDSSTGFGAPHPRTGFPYTHVRPYRRLHAHFGWTVTVYNIAETLPNFINPFWMLPLLGGLKSKDLIGITSVQLLIHFPIVIVLASCLMTTFAYHPPVMPLIPQRQSPYEY